MGLKRALLPVFDRFLEEGGSIWAATVLDERSVAMLWTVSSGHPYNHKPIFRERKIIPHKNRAMGI